MNNFSRTYFAIALSATLAATTVYAQTNTPSNARALASNDLLGPIIREALENNPGLLAYETRYNAARQSITAAGVLPNPRIQLTHFVESIQTRTGPQRQAIMLQQPIPWLGKLDSKRDVARAQSESLWHAYSAQQFVILDQVAETALEIAYLDKAIAITEQNLHLLGQLEAIVEERVRSGGDLNSLLRLQVEIESFQDLVSRQETTREVASAKLAALIGNSLNSHSPNRNWDAPSPTTEDQIGWLSAIPQRNPQIAMLRALANSNAARERLASFANRPDFTVGLNYIRTGDASNPATTDSGKDPWALMIGVSLPIWGNANNAIELQASLEKDAVLAQIEELELRLHAQGKGWIAKLNDATRRIQRYDSKLLPLARQASEITRSSYQSGKASILDAIDSERTLLKLETEYWRAAADAWQAKWKLATLSGGLWLE